MLHHRILTCILLVIYIFFDLINTWKMEYIKMPLNVRLLIS
jgi:uncharacterized membrane protein (DUF485 family)